MYQRRCVTCRAAFETAHRTTINCTPRCGARYARRFLTNHRRQRYATELQALASDGALKISALIEWGLRQRADGYAAGHAAERMRGHRAKQTQERAA